ncbi:DUF2442 domain-containing protein [Brevundimonas sp. SL130]|uniref:DUF2442 domain-containing protein n=1 Tax=Brevundimonas sp. SL130 TaxID=2995143 RepID=UPI00226C72A2|nr:DUF2442 domain-containing protein [Brevundimonas sp. SL130]WAC58889.1 DUF2442 domain-containing protein [Brevundimonas sp. SL130]
MMGAEEQHSLISATASGPALLDLSWSNGQRATIDLGQMLGDDAYAALRERSVFEAVRLGDWGQSLVWPGDIEIGADSLWLDCLSAWGREDTRAFLEWRLRNGFSAAAAAQALGISRPSVVKYSTGATVPRSIQLACRGWDALKAA